MAGFFLDRKELFTEGMRFIASARVTIALLIHIQGGWLITCEYKLIKKGGCRSRTRVLPINL
jgi:hypothetical protein